MSEETAFPVPGMECSCVSNPSGLSDALTSLKASADSSFNEGDIRTAVSIYDHCLRHLAFKQEGLDDKKILDQGMFFRVLNNISLCLIKLKAYNEALNYSLFIVSQEPGNFKARHRAGLCLEALGRHREAVDLLREGKETVAREGSRHLIEEYYGLLNRNIQAVNEEIKQQEGILRNYSIDGRRDEKLKDNEEAKSDSKPNSSGWLKVGIAGVAISAAAYLLSKRLAK